MFSVKELDVAIGSHSRRAFLKSVGAAGAALFGRKMPGANISDPVRRIADRSNRKINLLSNGGPRESVWGWQFTDGAEVGNVSGPEGDRALEIRTRSGDYARFLVLGPEIGKTYTLSGWVKTLNIVPGEANAGAYFAASQFEFQGRPTEFTLDGKQLPEKMFGNITGSTEWRAFSQTFSCLPSATWFEIIVGIYRAKGTAWFAGLTFVEGDQPARLDQTVDYWRALQWAHETTLNAGARNRPSAAILRDRLPVRGTASDPQQLGKVLGEFYDVGFLTTDELTNPELFNRARFDLLVLPYGETFPLPAFPAVERFLADGGDLFTAGGYAFQAPLVRSAGQWEFYDEKVRHESGPNLIPAFAPDNTTWKSIGTEYAGMVLANLPIAGEQRVATTRVPERIWEQGSSWYIDIPAAGEADQYMFEGWIRAFNIEPAPDGYAFVSIEQRDQTGSPIYTEDRILEQLRGSHEWHKVERLIFLAPSCRTLRIQCGLRAATGKIEAARFSLEHRSPQVRMNTATGFPQDELQVNPRQIGMFDADYRLKHATVIRPALGQCVVDGVAEMAGVFEGYAATCVVGMNRSRWIPLLEAYDDLGRNRGAAGAIVHHMRGPYARGSWVFFGVENRDLFAPGLETGEGVLRAVCRALTDKCFLHSCETDFASYRQGESVRMRALVSNQGRQTAKLELRWRISTVEEPQELFISSSKLDLLPGETRALESNWRPSSFSGDRHRVTAVLLRGDKEVDRIETGFVVWQPATLGKGLPFEFKENYFQVQGQSLFLQGTDDYLHTFVDQDENPLTWDEDAQGCRDSCIDVYENLLGLRGPQQRPTQTWWRWIDAMLLNIQRAGGVFFPGLLVFSNTAVSDVDLADQQSYVRAFADRYKDAPGIIYYLNGDLELHDPNLPELQKLYRRYLEDKYGSDAALRSAWAITPPEAAMETLNIRSGSEDWRDVRTLDDFQFRTTLVRRWLNSMYSSIREVDQRHPVTAEFYQLPIAGIDLLTALGDLELANFGYFEPTDVDFYAFPQFCKFLDQSIRGKGINIGEFGVKTHPAWQGCNGYTRRRTEEYEQAYFLAIAHYAFALGASKIQNWCWKYPSDLPFEWGINYPNELVARDVRAFYRNTGMLFRRLRPRYECSDVVCLLPGENRKGGQSARVVQGLTNSIRLLLDQRVRLNTLPDEYIDSLPKNVKTIFYPLPYCPSDAVVSFLLNFVNNGGQLYLSGDISYDTERQRTRTHRLKDLCGLEFLSERYPNIAYQHGAMQSAPRNSGWPAYTAAPGIVTRATGATVLLEGVDETPIVTEFRLGAGQVIFSADPIELHGDPRYHRYAHAFYRALLDTFHRTGETIEPAEASVHCFRVPSQDSREITVLVNYSENDLIPNLAVKSAAGGVRLGLLPRMAGVIVAEPGAGIQAVESSADVFLNDQLLIGSSLHFMAISFSRQVIPKSKCLLLLPMGYGDIVLPEANRWHHPIVMIGEVARGNWKELEIFHPETDGDALRLHIEGARAHSMVILCEASEKARAVHQIEIWSKAPWQLAD